MRLSGSLAFLLIMLATCPLAKAQAPTPGQAPASDDGLRIYAVNVVKKAPLKDEFVGYGIYLGGGKVLTAAHVVGNWPALTHPHVWVGGLDLPAEIIKQGSLEQTDLALLSVDETQLPVSLRLRRNPICKTRPPVGVKVAVIYPERSVQSRIISPLLVAPKFRAKFNSLISEQQGSGSGVFDIDHRCLLGIMSMKVLKYKYQRQNGRIIPTTDGYAGYYVPPSAIADFIPSDARL